ncbi:aconitate hydratase [Reichenbachiella carrageenanivorans]|uniref:Aconitate hydratase n=1 Tax=Reichenbachiella carrageenanivorans TaxID=2979869 RepID=A0ABY6D143_9BACT|nr:aconitate hydratase [Reichenbachiella carrageenanivorans]UXX79414.1 aconitate hydratase [Reichenbachiella carrageenanivorans]
MAKPKNITQQLIESHLVTGDMTPGAEIGLRIDHVLQQDATGTLVMLELQAIGLTKVKAEKAVQYVDHNLLQTDFKNADDHVFLQAAAQKMGYHYSRAGNGISHVVHMEQFGVPGKSLLGSDSHSCAGGGLGMLAIGTGGLDVAMAAAGEPYYVKMPKVLGVELTGKLPDWVSAKDVVLEMLRRYDVNGAKGYVIEYYGEGLKNLSAWDRHVIANMGTEMGATSSVFPSDERTKEFLKQQGREGDWVELVADPGAEYEITDHIDLSKVEPMIACPSSPGNVVPVREVAGRPVSQVVIGSSANPGYRDFWMVSQMVKEKQIPAEVSLDVNPSSRQTIQSLTANGAMGDLMSSGARFHQTGCMGCIGMGQSPATGKISLRTMPRNFPGRSGTKDDQVYLCSPETAAASALMGEITDPRTLDFSYPKFKEPDQVKSGLTVVFPPKPASEDVEIELGPNIKPIPKFQRLEQEFQVPVLLKMGDNISTDEILKAGAEVLPLRSNIPAISKYAYQALSKSYYKQAKLSKDGHIVIAGENYAQGSSREHAALVPRYLGQRAVIAKSYARIGWQNLVNFGIIPFEFDNPSDYDDLDENDVLLFEDLREAITSDQPILAKNITTSSEILVKTKLSDRQVRVLLAGGVINDLKDKSYQATTKKTKQKDMAVV